jgi:hypothetical protein
MESRSDNLATNAGKIQLIAHIVTVVKVSREGSV